MSTVSLTGILRTVLEILRIIAGKIKAYKAYDNWRGDYEKRRNDRVRRASNDKLRDKPDEEVSKS